MTRANWWGDLLEVSEVIAVKVNQDLPFTFKLASLGDAFAESAAVVSQDQQRLILSILEEVMVTGDESEMAAVATGFFEALLNKWDNGYDLEATWPLIGPTSREHCIAWNEFWGVDSPEWMRQD